MTPDELRTRRTNLEMLGAAISAEAEEDHPSVIGIRILARVILDEADKLACIQTEEVDKCLTKDNT